MPPRSKKNEVIKRVLTELLFGQGHLGIHKCLFCEGDMPGSSGVNEHDTDCQLVLAAIESGMDVVIE